MEENEIEPKKFIKNICSKFGSRPSCSESSRQAARYLKSKFKKYCDKVELEKFNGYPDFARPFIGYPMITTVLYIIALGFYFFIPIISLISLILSIYASVFKLFSLEEYDFFYYLYPKRTGINVIGKILPESSPKKLVILGGHHDSPYYFPLYWKLKKKTVYYVYFLVIFVIIFVILIILEIISQFLFGFNLIITSLDYFLIIPVIGVGLLLIFGLYFISPFKTLGANDNLSGVSICYSVAQKLSELKLEQTEVWIISFDSEETGMRGSKLFVKRRLKELNNRLTACINFDIVGVDDYILLPIKESMYRAKHSSLVYNKYKKAADNLNIECEIEKLSFGGTDSASFSRKDLPAASVLRLQKNRFPSVWHSKNDTPKRIDNKKLKQIRDITLEFLLIIDQD
ncbi:MAG: M28 family peptidase [Candidatus Lokiarchaeota archaeon]|nr:M28 family peptidase [Candidatus Lokiarchaeota archaeon]